MDMLSGSNSDLLFAASHIIIGRSGEGSITIGRCEQVDSSLRRRIVLTLAAAGLYILAMDPFGLWPLVWVALVPLFVALRGVNPKAGFRLGMLFGIVVFGILLHWFAVIFGLFGIHLPLVPAVFMGLFALIHAMSQKRFPRMSVILAPAVWVGLEFFRSELWYLRFSWLTPGYCQHSAPVMIQSANVFGCYWITFLVVAFNSFVAALFAGPDKLAKKIPVCGILLIAISVPAYGLLSMPVKYGTLKPVAIVQSEGGWERCIKLSAQYLEEGGTARLLVWPEYSAGYVLTKDSDARDRISQFCRKHSVSLVFGGLESAGGSGFYNTAFYMDGSGEIAGKYVKAYPVQFFNDGIPGRRRDPINGNMGVLVCYDLGYPEVARNLVRNGATVLLVPTVDAYSWGYWMHTQHAAVAPLRAIETDRWVIRAASSGISMIVSPYGEVRETLGYGKEGLLAGAYRENSYLTAYVRFGYLFPWACLAMTAALAAALAVLHLHGRDSTTRSNHRIV